MFFFLFSEWKQQLREIRNMRFVENIDLYYIIIIYITVHNNFFFIDQSLKKIIDKKYSLQKDADTLIVLDGISINSSLYL